MWGVFSDERIGLSFTIAAGPRQRSHSRVRCLRFEILPTWRARSRYLYPPGTGFPFRRLLRLAGLRWRYLNPPPCGELKTEFLINNVQCWVFLARFCPIIVQVKPLKTPFGLVTPFITIPITRSYNHTQLLLTPLRSYTVTILARLCLQSLIARLHR
jgi:hypothetical protein